MMVQIHSENAAAAGRSCPAGRRHEAGTVLLLVIFFAAAILISMAAVLPRIVMQGRREKEAELAWRGEQYVRAIRLYYRKYGHFPRSVEDFSKNPGNLHFLRKEYKDPMNTSDGSWRFIYVGPGGQLIGSLTRTMPLGVVPLTAAGGSPFGNNPNAGPGGATGFGQSGTTLGGGAQGGAAQGGSQSAQGQPPAPPSMGDSSAGAGTGGDQSGENALPPAPVAPNQAIQSASPMDSTVFGGQLVGVGSKVDRKSIRFFKGYGKYREWEFIWDPAAEAAAAGGLVPAPVGGQLPGGMQPIGTQPFGTTPTNSPQSNPPQ
ncbi:MAG TPA: hypothetical protein VJX29_11415 [Candidatus Acidoferrales bacterium]|nr:hypothetical protein [Candidatus Acidoferrales bacterium]